MPAEKTKVIVSANICEGKDPVIVDDIAREVEKIEGVHLLDVEPHSEFNRTIITFGGLRSAVFLATQQLAQATIARIDMEKHQGSHPRLGALDVVPFIPLRSTEKRMAVELSKKFAEWLAGEFAIPVYLFGFSATRPERTRISFFRRIQYEDLPRALTELKWAPDFGPRRFNSRSGATLVGSRLYYISFILYFDTDEIEMVEEIARIYTTPVNLQESHGKMTLREKNVVGKKIALLKHVQSFVDYLPTEKIVRILFNVKNYKETPLHFLYETFLRIAEKYGISILGSQIIDFVPAEALVDSGKYYYRGKKKTELDDLKYMTIALNRLRMNAVENFIIEQRVLDFILENKIG